MSRGLWFSMNARTRRSLTLLWTALFLCSLAMQYVSLATPSSALAASGLKAQTVQGFEVDGNLLSGDASTNPGSVPAALIVSPPMSNGDDWLQGPANNNVVSLPSTSTSSAFLYTDATDPGDNSAYGGGNKEDDTRDWVYVNSAGPNPKTDFKHIMAHARVVGNSAFAYLGAERLVNNGTMVVDFELNKKPFKQFSVGPAKPDRSVGDLLISLEYSNGGGNPIVTLYKITKVNEFASGQTVTFSAVSDSDTLSAVRSATNFVDLATSGFGYAVPAFDFAEASIDLSKLGISLSCPGFSSGHIRSRTGGDPASSQLKDAAPAFPIDLNSCGKLRIEKRDDKGALLGGATFTISDDPRPGKTGELTVVDGGSNDPDGAANGIIEFDPAEPGTYTVTETAAPPNFSIDNPSGVTKTLQNNGSVTFTFTDSPLPPDIRIAKTADAASVDAGDPIGFTVTVSNAGPGIARSVTLNDPLPVKSGVTWSIAGGTGAGQCQISGSTLSCDFGDMAASTSKTVHVTSPTGALSCGRYDNTATADATNDDPVSASASTTVNCGDIKITKVADAASVTAGDAIGFTISVHNAGTGTAKNVLVSDPLPTNSGLAWTIDGGTGAAQCSIASSTLSCNFGSMAGGATLTVHISSPTTRASCAKIDNTASVTTSNDGTGQASASVVVDCPNLVITKTADADTVDAGDQIGFVITLTNSGPGIARAVTLSDPLPVGTGISWSMSPVVAGCSIVANTLSCSFGDLAANATRTIHLVSNTTAGSCGQYANTASAQATNHPQVTATDTTTVACASIGITKTPDKGTVNAGDTIGFTITVTNSGGGTAKNVVMTDTLPARAGLSWTISPAVSGCSIGGGILTCNFGDVANGVSKSVHISSPTTAASCGVVDNTGRVTTSNDGSGQATASVTVECPDVSVVKSADASPINAGDTAAFTITVTNAGPGVARDVTLHDPLPAGIAWSISPAVSGCAIASNTLDCSFGDLAAGASKVVHIRGLTDAADCRTIPNTATVGATNEPSDLLRDNSSTASIVVNCPDVSVLKVADDDPINAGDPIGFTITVTNAGPGIAYDVTVSDTLPGGIAWQEDSAACAIASGVLTCDFGDLLAGGSASVHLTGVTDAKDCGTVTNTAVVDASNESNAPSVTDDNTSTDSVLVNCPDLEVIKTGNGPISAGEVASFTITVVNHGPGLAYDVTLTDDLPAGVAWAIDPAMPGCSIDTSANPDVLTCDFGTLAADGRRSVTITGETDVQDCGTIPNLASATASNEDTATDQYPNSDEASIVVDCPLIVITKTADDPVISAGDQIGFTITVTNTGEGNAFSVRVSDTLPAGMSWSESPDSAGWSIAGGVLSFGPATLAGGASTSVHIVATTDTADCGLVPNTAFLTYQGGADDDAAEVTVDCPNISVEKSGNGPLVNGQTAIFTITTINHGPGVAHDVTLEDQLPAGDWTLGGADAEACQISATNLLTCDFGTIDAPGGESDTSRTITVSKTATTDDCGVIPNEVTVAASNEAAADTDDNTDDATIAVRCPDVDLDKTVDDASVEPNQTVTYTIDVSVANGPVTNAVVTDDLPVGQTYVTGSASPSEPTVSADGRTLTWTFTSLASGDPAVTITYDVTIDADASGDPQENEAEVCVDQDTPCASDVALVTPEFPEIQIVKTAGDAADGGVFSTPAGPVTYTYVVTNTGPLTLLDVTVTDDAGTPGDKPADTADDFTADCPKTTLAPAESMTCTFTIDVLDDTTNVAVAHGVTAEGNPAEDDDDAKVVVLEFGLVIDKTNDAPLETLEFPDGSTAELPTADEGETVTFTLDYTLIGDPVTNGIITDVLPLGLTYVDGSATSDAQFTFSSYDEATRTLTWTAADVRESGTVSYQATVDEGAAELTQPLVNVATIDSDQTGPDSDDSKVYVPTVPAEATGTPRITLPPTDTISGSQEPGNPGYSLMLILLALAAAVLAIGFVTPVPASVRERARR